MGSWKFEFVNFKSGYPLQTSNLRPLSNLFLVAKAKCSKGHTCLPQVGF